MANNDVVLFVEDEPLVRESMIPELEDAGFEVVTAENGDEASCILRQMGRIDFLLTDIRMPGRINGWDLAAMARDRHPKMPVIYMSAFAPQQDSGIEGSLFIAKPYRIRAVLNAIEELKSRNEDLSVLKKKSRPANEDPERSGRSGRRPASSRRSIWRMPSVHIVTPENESLYKVQMDHAYRLRHRVFLEQQGLCALTDPDGHALDEFDNKNAVHMLYIDQGKVLGYQRLLPTTRPHLLSDVIPELCLGEPPVGAHIWEMSQHCIAPDHRAGVSSASSVANILGLALVEWGLECGVTRFVIEIEPIGILPLVQLGFQPVPLGLPCKIRGRDIIAVMVAFDKRTLERLRGMRGNQKTVLAGTSNHCPALLHA
jgi:acyl-homoserine lactone synthase